MKKIMYEDMEFVMKHDIVIALNVDHDIVETMDYANYIYDLLAETKEVKDLTVIA